MMKLILAIFAATSLGFAAQAQESDEERLALAYEMLELSDTASITRDALSLSIPTMRPMLESQFPGASAERVDEAMILLTDAMQAIVPDVMDASAQLYAERFTADELRAINDFYRTPVGEKLVSEQPAMLQEIGAISEQLGFQAVMSVSAELEAVFSEQ